MPPYRRFSSPPAALLLVAAALPALLMAEPFLPEHAPRAQCIDWENHLHWVGGLDTPRHSEVIAQQGDLVMLSDTQSGLHFIDISDPHRPFIIAAIDSLRQIRWIDIEGNIACVVRDTTRINVIDISNPHSPLVVGTARTSGRPYGVQIRGDYAFVADYNSGLLVFDISAPTDPHITGGRVTPGRAYGVALDDTLAFVADGFEGLMVMDISDPRIPRIIGTADTPGIAWSLAAGDGYVMVGDRTSSLHLIDVSDPYLPELRSSVDTPGGVYGVQIYEDRVYVADFEEGVRIVNISNPDYIFNLGGTSVPGLAYGIVIDEGYALVAAGDAGLQVARIGAFGPVGVIGGTDTPAWASGISVLRQTACIAHSDAGLRVVDISSLSFPDVVGVLPLGFASGVACRGWHVYTTILHGGLAVVNVADPAAPWIEKQIEIPGNPRDIELVGDVAYLAASNHGLQVVDIGELLAPEIIADIDTIFVRDVVVSGDYAYLGGSSQLWVVDVTNPYTPIVVGYTEIAGHSSGIDTDGDYLYVACETSGLHILDVRSPGSPILLTTITARGAVSDVDLVDSYLYFVDSGEDGAGLNVIDVTTPPTPRTIGRVEIPNGAATLMVYGDYVFTGESSGDAGMRIYPAQCGGVTPVLVSGLRAAAVGGAVRVRWGAHRELLEDFLIQRAWGPWAVEADYRTLNEAAPLPATETCEYWDADVLPGATYSYRLIARLLDGEEQIFGPVTASVPAAGSRLRIDVGPNPCRGETVLRCNVPRTGRARLEICDLGGRRLRTLWDGPLTDGLPALTWDGRDDGGRALPTGIYLARLRGGAPRVATRSIIMVR